jgi:hypothetical protein
MGAGEQFEIMLRIYRLSHYDLLNDFHQAVLLGIDYRVKARSTCENALVVSATR